MKKRYQIEKQRAVQRFRKLAAQDDQPIQLVIPLQEILDLIQRGTNESGDGRLHQTRRMRDGPRSHRLSRREESRQSCPRRHGAGAASLATAWSADEDSAPNPPRVRDMRKREVPLGSYELLQRASLMEESVYQKIMHGITRVATAP